MGTLLISLLFAAPLLVLGEGNIFNQEPFIIGGTDVTKGEFPFLVSIFRNETFICGGTLVNESAVLTAAHCVVEGISTTPAPANEFTITAGEYNLAAKDEEEQTMSVKRIEVHPDFIREILRMENDLAIIFTEKPFKLTDHVQLASLIKVTEMPSTGIAAGWGQMENGKPQPSEIPQKVELTIGTAEFCSEHFGGSGFKPDLQFCTNGNGKGICFGDSGGPFLGWDNNTLVGVVSYRMADRLCAMDEYGSVFQRVTPFVDWIETTINTGMMDRAQLGVALLLTCLSVINGLYR